MHLHKICLNLRCKEARRDIADPYEMHSTLCRAFSLPNEKCPSGTFLWRLESERNPEGMPIILLQSQHIPLWDRINVDRWFWDEPSKSLNLNKKLNLKMLNVRQKFRYRLRANPVVTRKGKRIGLFAPEDQNDWLHRQGKNNGFNLISIHKSEGRMITGKIRKGEPIRIFSVLYDGILSVTEHIKFHEALEKGVGHGKSMGLGLLSVVPVT
jgi:CRISPR system Cascade subunit CasE